MSETGTRERHTTWVLARLAGCGDPDRADVQGRGPAPSLSDEEKADPDGSPGARFLRSVEDAVNEAWDRELAEGRKLGETPEYVRECMDDVVHEIADAAPDVYTYTRWQEFVDLAAWQEDPDVLQADTDGGLTGIAGVALYMIAERLAWALLEELAEEADEEEEE